LDSIVRQEGVYCSSNGKKRAINKDEHIIITLKSEGISFREIDYVELKYLALKLAVSTRVQPRAVRKVCRRVLKEKLFRK